MKFYRLPIVLSRDVKISSLQGRVRVINPSFLGIKIGFINSTIMKVAYRAMWDNHGSIVFEGTANLGKGTIVSVNKMGILSIGDKVSITGNSLIVCSKAVSIGHDTLISWDTTIMDTDFHKIYIDNQLKNQDMSLSIGNNVWIASGVKILKGSVISNNSVISANSLINKKYSDENVLICSEGIIKNKINWER